MPSGGRKSVKARAQRILPNINYRMLWLIGFKPSHLLKTNHQSHEPPPTAHTLHVGVEPQTAQLTNWRIGRNVLDFRWEARDAILFFNYSLFIYFTFKCLAVAGNMARDGKDKNTAIRAKRTRSTLQPTPDTSTDKREDAVKEESTKSMEKAVK